MDIKLKRKQDSWIAKLAPKDFWITLGRTIYVPDYAWKHEHWGYENDPHAFFVRYKSLIAHEMEHVEQFAKWGLLFYVLYIGPAPFIAPLILLSWKIFLPLTLVLLPLSVGLAYFRMRFELKAYEHQLHGDWNVEWIAETLWTKYFFTWPPKWTKKRLLKLL